MANSEQILDKIVRNMLQRGYSAERVGTTAELTKAAGAGDVLVVSYVDKAGDSPMIGVDDTASPFLGIGTGAPGSIKVKGASGETSIAAIFDDGDALSLLAEVAGYANDVVVEDGDSTTELARIAGHDSLLGLGS